MARYSTLLAVVGLVIVVTSIVQIVLELAPARTQTVTQLITVTVPREIVERTKVVTLTREKPITITLTRTVPLPTTVTSVTTLRITHMVREVRVLRETVTTTATTTVEKTLIRPLSITVPITVTRTATTTVTKTVASYIPQPEISMRIENLSPGAVVRVYPENRSYVITETARIDVINLATAKGAKLLCSGCSARVVSYGPWRIVELNITDTRPSFKIMLEKPIAIDHGVLWLYIPWGSEECPDLWGLSGVELSVRAIIGDTLVGLEARSSGKIAGLCVYSMPLDAPQLNGIDFEIEVAPWAPLPQRIYAMLVLVPRFRPITIIVEPPTGLLKYMLNTHRCSRYVDYFFCGIPIQLRASVTNSITTYTVVSRTGVDYYVDRDQYENRGLIQILKADNVVTIAIPLLPATNTSISIDLELKPAP